jgi:hypothetical protein
MPKLALPKIWLAKILVDVLFANELANIGELELVVGHCMPKNWQPSKHTPTFWS